MGCTQTKEDLSTPIEAKDLVGVYAVPTVKDHTIYVELKADGAARWRHDARADSRGVSGECTGVWEYKPQSGVGEVWISGLQYDNKSAAAFQKVVPALTVLARAPFETVQLMSTRTATSASKRVSISAHSAKDAGSKGAALRAMWKRISAWPNDFGTGQYETSPENCVGCSTSFKY